MGSKTTPAIFNIASRELLNTERVWEAFVTGSEVDLRRLPSDDSRFLDPLSREKN